MQPHGKPRQQDRTYRKIAASDHRQNSNNHNQQGTRKISQRHQNRIFMQLPKGIAKPRFQCKCPRQNPQRERDQCKKNQSSQLKLGKNNRKIQKPLMRKGQTQKDHEPEQGYFDPCFNFGAKGLKKPLYHAAFMLSDTACRHIVHRDAGCASRQDPQTPKDPEAACDNQLSNISCILPQHIIWIKKFSHNLITAPESDQTAFAPLSDARHASDACDRPC